MKAEKTPKQNKPKKLTLKEKAFIRELPKTNNATQAVIDAKYNVKDREVAKSIGAENLAKPHIKAELAKIYEDTGLTPRFLSEALQEDIQNKKGNRARELQLAGKWTGLEQQAEEIHEDTSYNPQQSEMIIERIRIKGLKRG